MELAEKTVLQRREFLISCLVQFNETFYDELLQQYVFTSAMVDAVWEKKGQVNQTKELRCCLLCRSNKKTFSKFCSVLRACRFNLLESYLKTDLMLVKGELTLEDYPPEFAGAVLKKVLKGKEDILVQKMSVLLAEECQLIRTAYLKEISRLQKFINKSTSHFEEVIYFIRLWLESILEVTTGFEREVDVLKSNDAENWNSQNSKVSVKIMIKVLRDKILRTGAYKADLQTQKDRCIEIVNTREESDGWYPNLQIFLKSINSMENTDKAPDEYEEETDPEKFLKIRQLEKTTQQKSLQIEQMKADLLDKQNKVKVILAELEYNKTRCDQLEKVRRTGYSIMSEGAAVKPLKVSPIDFTENADTFHPGLRRLKTKIKFANFIFSISQDRCGALCDKLTKPNCNQSCDLHCAAQDGDKVVDSDDDVVESDDDVVHSGDDVAEVASW